MLAMVLLASSLTGIAKSCRDSAEGLSFDGDVVEFHFNVQADSASASAIPCREPYVAIAASAA